MGSWISSRTSSTLPSMGNREIKGPDDWHRIYLETLDDLCHLVMEMVEDGEVTFEGDEHAGNVLNGLIEKAREALEREAAYLDWLDRSRDGFWAGGGGGF